jgi:hypothetical protein
VVELEKIVAEKAETGQKCLKVEGKTGDDEKGSI